MTFIPGFAEQFIVHALGRTISLSLSISACLFFFHFLYFRLPVSVFSFFFLSLSPSATFSPQCFYVQFSDILCHFCCYMFSRLFLILEILSTKKNLYNIIPVRNTCIPFKHSVESWILFKLSTRQLT